MSNVNANKAHWSFWLIASVMLIWNLLGCVNFFAQMSPDAVASYREVEKAIILGRPLWATVGFALGVFCGALGCILLLLKKQFSLYLFIASLIGVVIAIAHSLMVEVAFGVGEIIGIVVMPVASAVFLIWYVKYCQDKGWLKAQQVNA